MRAPAKLFIPALWASLLLAACGSSASSSSAIKPAASHNASVTTGAVVRTASNHKLGATVLVNARGLTLYHLSAEQNGKFICTSATCVNVWHPLITPGPLPHGVVGSLSTVKRPDGAAQIAYRGMPLYTFAHDTAAGQDNGQGIKDVGTWTAVTTSTAATAVPAAPAAPTPGGGKSSAY